VRHTEAAGGVRAGEWDMGSGVVSGFDRLKPVLLFGTAESMSDVM
jgi:hypothetical protein